MDQEQVGCVDQLRICRPGVRVRSPMPLIQPFHPAAVAQHQALLPYRGDHGSMVEGFGDPDNGSGSGVGQMVAQGRLHLAKGALKMPV